MAAATAGAEAARSYGLERRFGPHFQACAIDALFRAGRWAEAEALASAGTERQRIGIGTFYRDAAVARLLGARGDETAAASRLAEAAALPAGEIDADVGAFVQIVAAELAIDAGHSEAAGEAVLAGTRPPRDRAMTPSSSGRCVRRGCGPPPIAPNEPGPGAGRPTSRRPEQAGAAARERADAIWATAPPAAGSGLATRHTCDAEWGRLNGQTDAAAWTAAADDWAAIPSPYPAAYARFRAAEAHLVAGDRVAAEVALRDAVRVARDLDARPCSR